MGRKPVNRVARWNQYFHHRLSNQGIISTCGSSEVRVRSLSSFHSELERPGFTVPRTDVSSILLDGSSRSNNDNQRTFTNSVIRSTWRLESRFFWLHFSGFFHSNNLNEIFKSYFCEYLSKRIKIFKVRVFTHSNTRGRFLSIFFVLIFQKVFENLFASTM